MNRLALCFGGVVGVLVLGWQAPVRAAGPAPEVVLAPQAQQPAACPLPPEPEPGSGCGFFAGGGIYSLQPYFTDNPAFSASTTTPTGPGGTVRTVTQRTALSQHMDVAPLLWVGYLADSGLGGRVRWWYFRQATSQGISVPDGGADSLTFLASAAPLGFAAFVDNDGTTATLGVSSKLQLQVWDAEVLSSVQFESWNLLVAGGVRFAHLNQHYNAFVAGDSGGGVGDIAAAVLSGHSFNGAGPVLSLEVRRSLGASPLSLYGSARGAVLFGTSRQTATDIFSNGTETFRDSSSDERNSVLPVGEVELGLEARSAHAFVQVAVVGQQWWGAGNASRSATTSTFGVANPGGASVDGDLGFLGLTVRLGLNF
jgi:hypothetical protein